MLRLRWLKFFVMVVITFLIVSYVMCIVKGSSRAMVTFANLGFVPRMDCDDKQMQSAEINFQANNKKYFKIAAATIYFQSPTWMCPRRKCAEGVPTNCLPARSVDDADVVLFHMPVLPLNYFLLKQMRRKPNQIWTLVTQETPFDILSNSRVLQAVDSVFNWTLSYRRDSDVYAPFDKLVPAGVDSEAMGQTRAELLEVNLAKKKSLAVIVSSNCGAQHSGRWEVVEELQKYIPVSILGKCAPQCRSLLAASSCGVIGEDATALISQYKFYLAFEGELCRDYISEKFWYAYHAGSVPVALGGASKADYTALAPADSFIYVFDFPSVRQLADYLLYLDTNDTAYLEFFMWRHNYRFAGHHWLCRMCAELNRWDGRPKTFRTNQRQWTLEQECERKNIF